jgi:hypothetical protein
LLTEGPVSNQGSNPALITFFKRKEGRKGGKEGRKRRKVRGEFKGS